MTHLQRTPDARANALPASGLPPGSRVAAPVDARTLLLACVLAMLAPVLSLLAVGAFEAVMADDAAAALGPADLLTVIALGAAFAAVPMVPGAVYLHWLNRRGWLRLHWICAGAVALALASQMLAWELMSARPPWRHGDALALWWMLKVALGYGLAAGVAASLGVALGRRLGWVKACA